MSDAAGLTPTQERVLAQLRREPTPLVFDEGFVTDLVEHATAAVGDLSGRLGGENLFVSKGFLTSALGCETKHLQPSDFAWSPITARGFVSHKAIELQMNWQGEPTPSALVDEAIARLADEPSRRGDWVAGMTEGDRASLRGYAVERLTQFMQDFPPLDPRAQPIPEATTKWKPPGCIELSGKADLVMGKPDGRISKRLIIDYKTGRRSASHRDDLRFYALLETLVRRVPPRKLVTYYLDYAEADAEDVTEALLEAALDRLLAAIERHLEVAVEGRPPTKHAGPPCRWCPLLRDCREGREQMGDIDDLSQGFDDE